MARARLRVAAGSFLEREGETRRTRLVGSISFVVDELKSVDEQSFLDDPSLLRTLVALLLALGETFMCWNWVWNCRRRQQQQLVQGMESHTGINGVALKISHYLLNYAAMSRGVNDSI
ncbi:Os03g0678500 [Oryza sativa Japonica Group]|uniref:Os03g0678500 protein n=1 Tax=Oryza sativa subsp. japonica TaxID=39947 RepID=A0A0P0W1W3_ORYSJ|nr:Os03g0678500 [Oryza sativa Japonica Group]